MNRHGQGNRCRSNSSIRLRGSNRCASKPLRSGRHRRSTRSRHLHGRCPRRNVLRRNSGRQPCNIRNRQLRNGRLRHRSMRLREASKLHRYRRWSSSGLRQWHIHRRSSRRSMQHRRSLLLNQHRPRSRRTRRSRSRFEQNPGPNWPRKNSGGSRVRRERGAFSPTNNAPGISGLYSSFGIGVDRKYTAMWRFHQENGTFRCSQKVYVNSETALAPAFSLQCFMRVFPHSDAHVYPRSVRGLYADRGYAANPARGAMFSGTDQFNWAVVGKGLAVDAVDQEHGTIVDVG